MIDTLIVDDHPLFREGLKAALESNGAFRVSRQAGTLREALEILGDPGSPSCALAILDINLPDGSGFDALERFSGLEGMPSFFMLSMHSDRATALKAVMAGANGYASKQIALDALVLGLKLAALGQVFIEAEIVRDILTSRQPCPMASSEAQIALSGLNARELDLLKRLAEGETPKSIAQALGVSTRTAENFQSALYTRLGLGSATELVRLAIRAGLIDP